MSLVVSAVLKIELACPRGLDVDLIPLEVPEGTTVGEAIELSGISTRYPDLFPATGAMGIYGKLCTEDRVLKAGDRIEIYRPLRADPKEARRNRARRVARSAK